MDNKEIFAEFAIMVLKDLFDSFPVAVGLDKTAHLGGVVSFPDQPFQSHFGVSGTGIYVGPDCSWEWCMSNEERQEYWEKYHWELCLKDTESLLKRNLSENERDKLLGDGIRPYSDSESEQLKKWRSRVKDYKETHEQQKHKEKVYIGTVQFLVNEGYIRFVDLPKQPNKKLQLSDILIERAFKSLRFMLTNKGYVHMNKKPPMGKGSLYDSMRSYVTDKAVDAFAGAGAGSLLTVFLS